MMGVIFQKLYKSAEALETFRRIEEPNDDDKFDATLAYTVHMMALSDLEYNSLGFSKDAYIKENQGKITQLKIAELESTFNQSINFECVVS